MASSRIFIKGLPPTITPDEFKEYFSKIAMVTDAKLIPHRRIGYIGYLTQEDAAKSVKYFNRTFIRMSRISVEIARPVSPEFENYFISLISFEIDDVLRKTNPGYDQKYSGSFDPENKPSITSSSNQILKRKRNESDESNNRLTEFLEVMQPASKKLVPAIQEPPSESELQAKSLVIDPCNEKSIGRLEKIVQNPGNAEPDKNKLHKPELTNTSEFPNSISATGTLNLTDDDWVRNRTNRLMEIQSQEETEQISTKIEHETSDVLSQTDIPNAPTQNDDRLNEPPTSQSIEENGIDHSIESIRKNQRLFVRNLCYTITDEDLKTHFSPFGKLEEVHIPVDVSGKSKGFAHIQFVESAAAIEAYKNLDGKPLQGRLLHIIPGHAKREEKFDDSVLSNLSFAKQKQIKKKIQAASANFSWNSLYMDQDAVNSAIATRLGVNKSELIDPTSTDSAWKQALAETSIIQEIQSYFKAKGVDLDSFKRRERGDKAILVKNLPFETTSADLRAMFEEFGKVNRVLVPPSGTIGIVEFALPGHAKAAFAGLSYRRVKDLVLFLEKAPKDLFINANEEGSEVLPQSKLSLGKEDQKIVSISDLLEQENPAESIDNSTLYVRNLNFSTTNERLVEVFKPLAGFLSARVSTKKDHKRPGQVLSMGFGFLEFNSKEHALSALKAMDGYNLDGHNLVIKMSHKGLDAAEERRKEDTRKKDSAKRTKIIIKNLPFEATKKDIRILFGAFGKLRSVRLPKKFDQSTRGFAFADFINSREAENALEALKNTHLLGRRLVLEFAAAEALDAEEEIEKMQKKVSSQVNKVALQKLTGGGRKKFDMESNENDN